MLDDIRLIQDAKPDDYDNTIIIPTWNNLPYLKVCLDGINKNSALKNQIIVFINEGKDETIEYLKSTDNDNITIIHSKANLGICHALNYSRIYLKADYITYMNDDMYPLKNWDIKLIQRLQSLGKMSMVSGTMIEPFDTGNPAVIVSDYGNDINTFRVQKLETDFESTKLKKDDWLGSTWPPNMLHKDLWDLVGGMSIEYSPGFGSDPDFTMKLYKSGVRQLLGVGGSMVYHFGSKSTTKIKKNPGKDIFEKKWGMKRSYFINNVIKRGQPVENNSISDTAEVDKSILFKLRYLK